MILIIDLGCNYRRNLLQGILQYVQKFKNWSYEEPFTFIGYETPNQLIDISKFDGAIIYSPNQEALDIVLQSGIPAIVKGVVKPVQGYINFTTDNMMLCKKAFDHFKYLGFKRIAYCGIDWLYWSAERRQALQHIVNVNGCELMAYPLPKTTTLRKWENEKTVLAQWLLSLPKPIALLAAHDFRAREVLHVCQEVGIKVPEQISVLGVDNDDCICPFTNPPLSSIRRFLKKAGYQAAESLTNLMSGETPEHHEIIIEPQDVVSRQSTNVLAVDHPDVAEALRFIRANKAKALTVNEVADHVAIHRRVLYDLFQKHLGYSIYDEIKRVRVDEIARLLLETNLTVSAISREMGFQEVRNFARYFAHAKGLNPTAYREYYHAQKEG